MPELAEVEYYRRVWNKALGEKVVAVTLHETSRVFREGDPIGAMKGLPGRVLLWSTTSGKQLLFQFNENGWLRVHLGMTGKLIVRTRSSRVVSKHDHLCLRMERHCLVFQDTRMFGRVQWEVSPALPAWWSSLPPDPTSQDFTFQDCKDYFDRRSRSSVKGVLLQQERFAGIGNWMADEILWRSLVLPSRKAGSLLAEELGLIFYHCKEVCLDALRVIAPDWSDPPLDWLFQHRWKNGGVCPRCHSKLVRQQIAGRTTCFCHSCQK